MKKHKVNTQPFWRFLFLVYCALMLWLLFGRSPERTAGLTYVQQLAQNTNLNPFFTIRNYLHVILHRSNDAVLTHCIINLAGNVLLFIPAGCLLPKIWKKQQNFFRFFLTSTVHILLIELLQLFTLLGSFDVDDLILNLFGMTLGFIGYSIVSALRKKK